MTNSTNLIIEDGAIINHPPVGSGQNCTFGDNCIIRRGTIFYRDVTVGSNLQTGHNVLVRSETTIGNHVVLGTGTVVDGKVKIGSYVKIETNCYIPTHVTIGNRVFIGPGVTFTNDKYPLKMREQYKKEGPQGAIVEDLVTIGGGVTICPGVRIGKGSFIAAGAVVSKDVPEYSLVKSVPGVVLALPEELREPNKALSWYDIGDD